RPAEMSGEEAEELRHVAPIGFERFRRHAFFGAEVIEPAADLGGDVGGGRKGRSLGGHWAVILRGSLALAPQDDGTKFSRHPEVRGGKAAEPRRMAAAKAVIALLPSPFLNRAESA